MGFDGNARFRPSALEHLYFYNSKLDIGWNAERAHQRTLPVKISCNHCRTPVADEGRNMLLSYATLFRFGSVDEIPAAFRHSCHLFYAQRCVDMDDDKEKWTGDKEQSEPWKE
jgi:hypothetical protein